MIQNSTPSEKKYQLASTNPRLTPATGATTLPTAGMNHAGDICPTPKPRWLIQLVTMASVRMACKTAPTAQISVARPGADAPSTTAPSSSEMLTAGAVLQAILTLAIV